jgi:hypothetical protein
MPAVHDNCIVTATDLRSAKDWRAAAIKKRGAMPLFYTACKFSWGDQRFSIGM